MHPGHQSADHHERGKQDDKRRCDTPDRLALCPPVYLEQQKKVNELSGLQEELNSKRAVSAELSKEVNALQQSPDAVEKVAREKFKLCREGETVLEYNDPAKSASGR